MTANVRILFTVVARADANYLFDSNPGSTEVAQFGDFDRGFDLNFRLHCWHPPLAFFFCLEKGRVRKGLGKPQRDTGECGDFANLRQEIGELRYLRQRWEKKVNKVRNRKNTSARKTLEKRRPRRSAG